MNSWTRKGLACSAFAIVAVSAAAVVSPSAHAADVAVRSCTASDLSARQTWSGAGMSQPFSSITMTNTSSSPCALNGYPTITGAWTLSGRKSVKVRNGNLQNMAGPGPARLVVAPGGHAWFAVGAATAYDPPVVTFRRLAFSTGAGSGSVTSRLRLQASAPQGKPFPIGVTAFAPGSAPHQ